MGNVFAFNGRNMPTVEQDIASIKAFWIETGKNYVEGIIETGRRLIAAQKLHGKSLRKMAKDDETFGWTTISRLITIAENPSVAQWATTSQLPPSWRTLYELTKLPTETFKAALWPIPIGR